MAIQLDNQDFIIVAVDLYLQLQLSQFYLKQLVEQPIVILQLAELASSLVTSLATSLVASSQATSQVVLASFKVDRPFLNCRTTINFAINRAFNSWVANTVAIANWDTVNSAIVNLDIKFHLDQEVVQVQVR